jgi:hypothetical protein
MLPHQARQHKQLLMKRSLPILNLWFYHLLDYIQHAPTARKDLVLSLSLVYGFTTYQTRQHRQLPLLSLWFITLRLYEQHRTLSLRSIVSLSLVYGYQAKTAKTGPEKKTLHFLIVHNFTPFSVVAHYLLRGWPAW